jgi:hypothetical protein
MRRVLVLALLLCLAVPAVAAAQANPFGPLPQPVAPTAEPTPVEDPADQASVSRTLLFGIAGVVLLIFVGIGIYISRDARRHLTDDERYALEHEQETLTGDRKRLEQTKKKARAKTRAQKQARKKQRR